MIIAIYSRKSKWSEKGESTENQIIMCKDYISHVIKPEGDPDIRIYEDEGFSGKNSHRPAFLRMLKDMEQLRFDCLICYKLDRLGRNLPDLTRLMEQLERQRISFVSVKERFDTTTPIGKAMLYFSGVLAQMEREQIAERVKDNMFLLARSGRWLGGNTPYGFGTDTVWHRTAAEEKAKRYSILKENREESILVGEIFRRYLLTGSLCKTAEWLRRKGIRTRKGNLFTPSSLKDILRNPVYCCCDTVSRTFFEERGCRIFVDGGLLLPGGEEDSCCEGEENTQLPGWMAYGKSTSSPNKNTPTEYGQWVLAPGNHRGIIPSREFIKVQQLLDDNCKKEANFKRNRNTRAWLSGLLFCACGNAMRPKYYGRVGTEGTKNYVYLCTGKERTHGESCRQPNLPGKKTEEAVSEALFSLVSAGVMSDSPEREHFRSLYKETLKTEWKELLRLLSQEQKRSRERRAEGDGEKERKGNQGKQGEQGKKEECKKQLERLLEILKNEDLTTMVKIRILQEIEGISKQMEDLEEESQIMISKELTNRLWDIGTIFLNTDTSRKREYMKAVADRIVCEGQHLRIEIRGKEPACFRESTIGLPQPLGPTMATNSPSST
ncbi:MAG: recombinase family protein [Lachnospiraceae bacterium]|nr:recombinase family protein [Lachnospiraceae bacterium]